MIISMKPLSLAEVKEIVKDFEEKKPVQDYLKTFCKLTPEKAKEFAEKINGLNNLKIKEEYVVKIIELLPRDAEDINKIFHDVSLDEKEIETILEIVKNY